jgi:hypothetical protein
MNISSIPSSLTGSLLFGCVPAPMVGETGRAVIAKREAARLHFLHYGAYE